MGLARAIVDKIAPQEKPSEPADDGMDAAADDLLSAFERKDPKALKAALRAAFSLMDTNE